MSRTSSQPLQRKRLYWTAGVVLAASAAHWPLIPIWSIALLVVCLTWRIGVEHVGLPMAPRTVRWLLAILALLGVILEFETINGVLAGSTLLLVMLALKFLESSSRRDELILILISYFLVFSSILYERSILSVPLLLIFIWITTAGLLQLGRRRALRSNMQSARYAGKLLLQAAPIMLLLFVLFPRTSEPLWSIPNPTDRTTTGLSGQMSPGDITNLGLSDEIAFRVDFETRVPTRNELYWRGPVLTRFDGRTWTQREGMGRSLFDTIDTSGEPTSYRVMLEPSGHNWAFALEMPNALPDRSPVRMGASYELIAFRPSAGRFDYELTSYTDFQALEPLEAREIELFRNLPEGSNPRTRQLVAGWLDEGLTGEALLERALDVFRAEDFFYTLTPPPLGTHTADEFIFETKEGFCEHYASAYAIMVRAAGIPARVVTGYQGGELNTIGNYFIVRQSDAHAWVEVWLADRGWIRIDPVGAVAPERIALGFEGSARNMLGTADMANNGLMRRMALAWDALNTHWNTWVIGYGPQVQRLLLELLGFERPRIGMLLGLTVGALAVCMFAYMFVLSRRSRQKPAVDKATTEFRRFCLKLESLRVPRRADNETPRQYAARAARMLPAHSMEIDAIAGTYLRARYEPDDQGRALQRLRKLVRQFHPAPGARSQRTD